MQNAISKSESDTGNKIATSDHVVVKLSSSNAIPSLSHDMQPPLLSTLVPGGLAGANPIAGTQVNLKKNDHDDDRMISWNLEVADFSEKLPAIPIAHTCACAIHPTCSQRVIRNIMA